MFRLNEIRVGCSFLTVVVMSGGSQSVATQSEIERTAQDLRARQSALDKLRHENSLDGKSTSDKSTRKRMRFGEDDEDERKGRVSRQCRDFASGHCKWGDSCRFIHEEALQPRSAEDQGRGEQRRHGDARGSKGGKGQSKGKGDRGRKGEDSKLGASAHRTINPRLGTFQFGSNSRVFAYLECERCLIEQFGWKRDDARHMCFEVGADDNPGESRCPCPTKEGYRGPKAWAHDFPRNYSETLRRVHPRI